MPKQIIHVGLHKTATTYLQKKVFPSLEHYTLYTRPYTQHNHAFNQLQYADDSLYNKEIVEKEIEKFPSENIILSDESFSGKPNLFCHVNRTIIGERLSELFPEATVIIFIRSQMDILLSYYNQYVKSGGTADIQDYIWFPKREYSFEQYKKERKEKTFTYPMGSLYYNTNKSNLNVDVYKYFEMLNLYTSVFKNVEVFLYEDLLFEQKKTLKQLEKVLDANLPDRLFREESNKVNASTSNLFLHRLINRFKYLMPGKVNSGLNKLISYLPKFIPSAHQEYLKKSVGDYYKKNNQKVINEHEGVNMQKYPNYYLY